MIISEKSYPLTVGQKIVLMQLMFSESKAISNICVVVHFEKEIDDDTMLQSLYMALMRNHSASIHIRPTEGTDAEQYFAQRTPDPIEIVNFRDKTQEEMEEYFKELARTPFPNDSFDVPLYQFRYILKPDGLSAVYMIVSHMIFDIFALMVLAEDAFDIYETIKEGKAWPKPMPSPERIFDKEMEYYASPQFQKDQEFWDNVNLDEPLFTSLNGPGSKEYVPGKRYGKAFFLNEAAAGSWAGRISKDIVEKSAVLAAENGVSLQSLYLLPVRNYLSKVNNYAEDVTITNSVARRATRLEKFTGGTRVSAVPVRMRFKNDLSFIDAAKEISKLQVTLYKHSELPFPLQIRTNQERFGFDYNYGYFTVGTTFQPYSLKERKELTIRLQNIPTGQWSQPLYLTFMALDHSGDLVANYDFLLAIYQQPVIEKLHNYIVASLTYAVDHPDVTLKELMDRF